jgi:hypothetical protein
VTQQRRTYHYQVDYDFWLWRNDGSSPGQQLIPDPPKSVMSALLHALSDCSACVNAEIGYGSNAKVTFLMDAYNVLDAHGRTYALLHKTVEPCFDSEMYGITVERCTIRLP